MNQTTKKIMITLKEYVIITLGLALYCFSWTSFLIPKGIVGGAIPGLATFVNYATGGLIPVSVTYLSVNVILIILGFLILGRGFGFKTIYCILLNSVLLQVLPDLIPWVSTIEEPFLNGLLGGFIGAIGIVMIFNQGGSTGGTDIIALILAKYREISPGRVYLFCDLVIVGSVLLLPGKTLSDVVYGYMQVIAFSQGVDLLLTGSKQSQAVCAGYDFLPEIQGDSGCADDPTQERRHCLRGDRVVYQGGASGAGGHRPQASAERD